MELKGKKIVILADEGYEDLELWVPFYRMKEAGAEVVLAAKRTGTFKSKHGYPVEVETLCQDIPTNTVDALIIPGGQAPDNMRSDAKLIQWVKKVGKEDKLVAAICHAGSVLVSADLCKDKKLTSYKSIKDDLCAAGGQWVDEPVVVDGHLITSRTPEDLPHFCKAIIGNLVER